MSRCLTSWARRRAGRRREAKRPVLPGDGVRALFGALLAWTLGCGGPPKPVHREDATARGIAGVTAESTPGEATRDGERSLREVLGSRALVGSRVRVTGRCLAPVGAQPLGQPPRPWNEWQLEADGVAMFVIGPMPGACLIPGQEVVLTIDALVAEDTLPAIGDLPGAPRRFLVLLRAEPVTDARDGRGG